MTTPTLPVRHEFALPDKATLFPRRANKSPPDFCSEPMLEGWKADKGNTKTADEMFDAYVKFYNACFERPADMHLGIHLCRGNYMGSRHFSEGAYDNIAKKLFQVSKNNKKQTKRKQRKHSRIFITLLNFETMLLRDKTPPLTSRRT